MRCKFQIFSFDSAVKDLVCVLLQPVTQICMLLLSTADAAMISDETLSQATGHM